MHSINLCPSASSPNRWEIQLLDIINNNDDISMWQVIQGAIELQRLEVTFPGSYNMGSSTKE